MTTGFQVKKTLDNQVEASRMKTEPGRLDLAFCWVFRDVKLEEGLARLKALGFDGIELWPDLIEQHGAAAWSRALAETGMQCLQLCPYFNFMGGEPTLQKSREILAEFLATARDLACRRLRVFTGPPWGEGVVGGKAATSRQWSDAIQALQEFCDRALPLGVELCLECHEGSLMENGPSALRLLQAVARPNLTANLQLPLLNERWEESLRLLASYTSHLHLHNWTEGVGRGDLTYLEEGVFDWLPVVGRVAGEEGRDLCLSVEHPDHHGRHDPWETARRDGSYLQKLKDIFQQLFPTSRPASPGSIGTL